MPSLMGKRFVLFALTCPFAYFINKHSQVRLPLFCLPMIEEGLPRTRTPYDCFHLKRLTCAHKYYTLIKEWGGGDILES
ncbi:uncharacterized protein DS421_10g300980 [Arachis hypogaea]|nr:uncharacterized protein DS421_10g300980 [Arachis hypogaea]